MKTAYLSIPEFSDCDLPLLQQLESRVDLVYILCVTQHNRNRALINIRRLKPKAGLYPASEYKELERLKEFVSMDRIFVLNLSESHGYSWGNLRAMMQLVAFLNRRAIEVLHLTWFPHYEAFPLYLFRRKTLLTVHDPIPHSSKNENTRSIRFDRKTAFCLLKHFLILNRRQHADFIRRYHLERKSVYHSQLSLYTHLQGTQPQLPAIQGYVLFTGSINTHKGVHILCQAMEQVHRRLPDAKLVIAGSGRLYFDLAPLLATGCVVLENHYLSDEELAGYLRNAAFVVCPYLDATQSGVIMSAFALGKPVVATRVGGLPEAVEHERHGLVVQPNDPNALAEAMARLLASPETLDNMTRHIKEDYNTGERSWSHIATQMVSIYEDIAK